MNAMDALPDARLDAERLPARAGWTWLRRGAALFRRHPTQMLFAALNVMFVGFLVLSLPVVGPLLLLALFPILTMFMMEACRVSEASEAFSLPALFTAWSRARIPALLRLGGAYAGVVAAAAALAMLIFLPSVREALRSAEADQMDGLMEALRKPLLACTLLSVPVTMAFWYAPMLVAWHGLPLRKALFFSMVACWRNKAAFVVYVFAMMAVAAALDLALSFAHSTLGVDLSIVRLVALPLQILFLAIVYCSFYPSYTTVFRHRDA